MLTIGVLRETTPGENRVAVVPGDRGEARQVRLPRCWSSPAPASRPRTPTRPIATPRPRSSPTRAPRSSAAPTSCSKCASRGRFPGATRSTCCARGRGADRVPRSARAIRSCSDGSRRGASPPSRWRRCRASRAPRSMDALSSMSTVAGYKAALLAADHARQQVLPAAHDRGGHHRARRACSSSAPASPGSRRSPRRAGSAAVVEAFDVRPAVKRGGAEPGRHVRRTSISSTETLVGAGGYAKALSHEQRAREPRADPPARQGLRRRDHHRDGPGASAPRADHRRRWCATCGPAR